MGADSVDTCAPAGPYPVVGQQVYIQDPQNFCFLLPDPNNPKLKNDFYSQGKVPSIVQGEGYVQSFCLGNYLTPGAMKMPQAAIRSAHVVKGVYPNGKKYWEISGTMDCGLLNINCQGSTPTAYDDGGQYDSVGHRQCGKEPYSGVDNAKHPGMIDYVEQAGNGLFCMRVCEAGQQLNDPCNVKNDTAGCTATMGVRFRDGFSFTDLTTGQTTTLSVSLPPLSSPTASPKATNTPSSNPTQNQAFIMAPVLAALFTLFA